MAKFELFGVTVTIPNALLTERLSELLQTKQYESGEAFAVLKHLTANDRVLELGGGCGFISTLIAQRVGAKNLMTVEANEKMIGVIVKNLANNDVSGVDLVHAAVVPDNHLSDTVTFFNTPLFYASSILETKAARNKQTRKTTIPAVRITELLHDQKPTFVVMDIEGAEFALFETPWPETVRILILELHPTVYNDMAIKRIFDKLSAANFAYCPDGSRGQVVVFKRLTD